MDNVVQLADGATVISPILRPGLQLFLYLMFIVNHQSTFSMPPFRPMSVQHAIKLVENKLISPFGTIIVTTVHNCPESGHGETGIMRFILAQNLVSLIQDGESDACRNIFPRTLYRCR